MQRLLELAGLFLRLGTTAFGGPAAHIAMMEDEVVCRRQWLTREEFLDLVGATNLIPGPNSTELAIHIGHRRAGWSGLVVAGCCFILPAALIVGVIAWAYVKFGSLPQAEGLLYGVKPVIIAVVIQALWGLGRTAVKNKWLALVGLAAAGLNFFGVNELAVLFGSGILVAANRAMTLWRNGANVPRPPLLGVLPGIPLVSAAGVAGAVTASVPFSLGSLLLFFIKVGSVLFGSGYVFVPRLRQSAVAGAFLDGVNVASLALMAVVTWQLCVTALVDGFTGWLALTAAVLLFHWRVNSAWLVLIGAGLGSLAFLLQI